MEENTARQKRAREPVKLVNISRTETKKRPRPTIKKQSLSKLTKIFTAKRQRVSHDSPDLPKTNPAIMGLAQKVSYDPIPQMKPVHTITDLTNMGATQAFMWLYKINPRLTIEDKFANRTKFENARDWWERATPVQQCNNIIGNWSPSQVCYICGLPFNADYLRQEGGGKPTDGKSKKQAVEDKKQSYNTPECEHILPVLEGCLFLTLYSSEHKDTSHKDTAKEMKMEYDWAHRCCNRVKSDTSFMKMGKDKDGRPIFMFDYQTTASILSAIYDSNASYCVSHLQRKIQKANPKSKKDKWIKTRADSINKDKIEPICKHLNKALKENYRLFYLSILASLISSADHMHIHYAQQDYTKARKIPAIESIPKSILYDTISSMISGKIYSVTNTPSKDSIEFNQNSVEIIKLIMSTCNPAHDVKLLVGSKQNIFESLKSYIISVLTNGNFMAKNAGKPGYEHDKLFRILFLLLSSNGPQGQAAITNKDNAAEIAIEFMYIFYYGCFMRNLNAYKGATKGPVSILKKTIHTFLTDEIKTSIGNIVGKKAGSMNLNGLMSIFLYLTNKYLTPVLADMNKLFAASKITPDQTKYAAYMNTEYINNLLNGFINEYSSVADEVHPPLPEYKEPVDNPLHLINEAIEIEEAAQELGVIEDYHTAQLLLSLKDDVITKEEEDNTLADLNHIIDRYSLDDSVLETDMRTIELPPSNPSMHSIDTLDAIIEESPHHIEEEAGKFDTYISRLKPDVIRSLSANSAQRPRIMLRSQSMPIRVQGGRKTRRRKQK